MPFFSVLSLNFDPRLMNPTTPSWDSFLVLFYLGAVVLYSFFASRERLTVVLVSIYSSLAIVLGTPWISQFLVTKNTGDYFTYRLGIFIVGFLALYVLFSHNMSLRSEVTHRWWQGVILSALQVGLLMSSILLFLPENQIDSSIAKDYFIGDFSRSFWMLAPILAMLVMKKKEVTPPRM